MLERVLLLSVLVLSACVVEDGHVEDDDGLPKDKETAAQATVDGKADWSLDVCELRGWYDDGDCDWFCPRRDRDCDKTRLGPEPAGSPVRFPIVLEHGFAASPSNMWRFSRVAEALRADGHRVFISEVPPFDTPDVRAGHLAKVVDAALASTGAAKVNLIAHSMGGLDARALVATHGYGNRVASVTTISSPHRGTRIADLALASGGGTVLANAFAKLFGKTFSNAASDTNLRAALVAMSEDNSARWNAQHPDDSRVYYQSWAGVSKPLGLWSDDDVAQCEGKLLLHRGAADKMSVLLVPIHLAVGGPGDGMTRISSAKHGAFRGCIPGDHLDEVGYQRDDYDRNTGFDHVRFYRNVAFELQTKGF